jgi:hypothetical protein
LVSPERMTIGRLALALVVAAAAVSRSAAKPPTVGRSRGAFPDKSLTHMKT